MPCKLLAFLFLTSNTAAAFRPSLPHRMMPHRPTSVLLRASPKCRGFSVRDSWSLVVLGDLHLEDDLTAHHEARADCIHVMKEMSLIPSPPAGIPSNPDEPLTVKDMIIELSDCRAGDLSAPQLEMLLSRRLYGDFMNCHLVSLGDLGRKDIRHEPGDAGTTKSFEDAKEYLDGFGVPYELVSGNHDLEGLDEFDTDEANLKAWMNCFDKPTPQFCKQIGDKTLLVGLSTVRFRDAPCSSHECHIDDDQLEWFLQTIRSHPAEDGWKILVFSHAPIIGSGLRVLQNVHVINGCAWLNHVSDNRNIFINAVKENPQIKLWFSGHFHLSHDYEDAISTVGSCTFVQGGVVGPVSTRDGRRQTRFIQGCSDFIKIYTINHHIREETTKQADLRLDANINITSGEVTFAHGNQDVDREDWFQAYLPREEDGYVNCCMEFKIFVHLLRRVYSLIRSRLAFCCCRCYIETPDGSVADASSLDSKVCWWHMADGKVIGLHQGQVVEYDSETLSPLGIVVDKKKLGNREVVVVEKGTALVLVDSATKDIEVVHPNEDGSYWRKFQRNKRVRQEEKAREAIAKMWLEQKR